VPPVSLSEPLLRLYLLTLATLGGYLCWQMYRLGRGLDPRGPRDRRVGLAWAAAVLFAPATIALLLEIPRLARLQLRTLGVRSAGGSPILAPLVYGALVAGLMLSRLGTLWAPLLLALPLPFLLAQGEVNRLEIARAARAAEPVLPPRGRRWWRWAVAAVGMPAVALLLVKLDGRGFVALAKARRVVAGARVKHADLFTMQVAGLNWEQTGSGVVGDGSEAMGFRRRDGSSWLVVYVTDGGSLTLDGIVADRRRLINDSGELLVRSSERRFFLPGVDMVPASSAQHETRRGVSFGVYHVFSTIHDGKAIEVIGFAGPESQIPVEAFVNSVRGLRSTARASR
jgi:hypothetical protein